MTIEEFIEYEQEAFSDVARLEAIGQTDMVLVVSRDVFCAMVQFNNMALAYSNENGNAISRYNGLDLAVINENEAECIMKNVTIDWANLFNNFGISMGEPKPDERELGVGDAKLIDDFLNGFAKKEILNPAT